MALQRMDNVLIVVEDLEAAKAFFIEAHRGLTTVIGTRPVTTPVAMIFPFQN